VDAEGGLREGQGCGHLRAARAQGLQHRWAGFGGPSAGQGAGQRIAFWRVEQHGLAAGLPSVGFEEPEQEADSDPASSGSGGSGWGGAWGGSKGSAAQLCAPPAAHAHGLALAPGWRRISLQRHAPDPHRYGLLLTQPTAEHVSALCVQLPGSCTPERGGSSGGSSTSSSGLSSGLGGSGGGFGSPSGSVGSGFGPLSSTDSGDSSGAGLEGVRVRMWRCVPLEGEEPLDGPEAHLLAFGGG
jgi:hypothetical protein